MISCYQYYLTNGLVDYPRKNIQEKRLIDQTSSDFVEFMDSILKSMPPNQEYDKRVLFNQYAAQINDQNLKQKTFTNWVNIYCQMRSITLSQRESNGKSYYKFTRNG